ncbi:MAG TPA: hypothetical protein VFK89_08855 [Actinomycetota bacterium]|nr:hypothetical protein [Actinomycetota bacterium]
MRIDCHDCAQFETQHCDDCLVTALLHPPDGVVEIDEELDPSLDALSGAGLIPVLRFRPREERDEVPGEPGTGRAEAG